MKPVIEMIYRSCTPSEPEKLGCTRDTQPVKEAMNKQIFDKINIPMASVTLVEVMGSVCYCDDNKCNIQSIQEIHSGAKGIGVDTNTPPSAGEPGTTLSSTSFDNYTPVSRGESSSMTSTVQTAGDNDKQRKSGSNTKPSMNEVKTARSIVPVEVEKSSSTSKAVEEQEISKRTDFITKKMKTGSFQTTKKPKTEQLTSGSGNYAKSILQFLLLAMAYYL